MNVNFQRIPAIVAGCAIALLLQSCWAAAVQYSYQVRQTGEPPSFFEDRGPIDLKGFLDEFRTYPWREKLESDVEGAEPAMRVSNNSKGSHSFFVSVVGDSTTMSYVVGVTYPRTFEREPAETSADPAEVATETVEWAELVVVKPPELVELYARRYFEGDLGPLLTALRKAPPFLEAPARDVLQIGE